MQIWIETAFGLSPKSRLGLALLSFFIHKLMMMVVMVNLFLLILIFLVLMILIRMLATEVRFEREVRVRVQMHHLLKSWPGQVGTPALWIVPSLSPKPRPGLALPYQNLHFDPIFNHNLNMQVLIKMMKKMKMHMHLRPMLGMMSGSGDGCHQPRSEGTWRRYG